MRMPLLSDARRGALALSVLALGALAAGTARADGDAGADSAALEKAARDGFAAIARATFLVAAEKGARAPGELVGGWLPAELARATGPVAASARTADIRAADDPDLERTLLKNLVSETPEAEDALRAMTDGAGSSLARSLADLERRTNEVAGFAQELDKMARAGRVASIAAVASGRATEGGAAVLRLAGAAPFVRDELKQDAEPPARFRTLRRALDLAPDPDLERLLAFVPTFANRAKAPLEVVSSGEVKKLDLLVHERLERTRRSLSNAIEAALGAGKLIRAHELKQVVGGARGPDYEEATRLLAAYRRSFGDVPSLESTSLPGVYIDRNDSRAFFYVEGEDRWVRGGAHASNPGAVVKFLLAAHDPRLASRASDPRALALLYAAFGDETPFEAGLEKLRTAARSLAAHVVALEATARRGGATPAQIDAFFARVLGYDRDLAGPFPGTDEEAGAGRACERFARAVLEAGPDAGAALATAIETADAASAKVELLAFPGMKASVPGSIAGEVALHLSTALALPPVAPLPDHVAPGASFGCVLAILPSESVDGTRIEAEALGPSGECWTGDLELPIGAARAASGVIEGGSLALHAGHELVLEGPRGTSVRPGEPLHARLRPAANVKLVARGPGDRVETGAWGADGGTIVPLALWPAGSWRVTAEDAAGKPLAEAAFTLEAAPGLVCQDASGDPLRVVAPGGKVTVRFLQSGSEVAAAPVTIVLEDASGGAVAPVVQGQAPSVALPIPVTLPDGSYRVRAKLGDAALAPWPLVVSAHKVKVSFLREPFDTRGVERVAAGEKLYARIDPGFTLAPEELVEASVSLRAPSGGAPIVLASPEAWARVPARRFIFPVALPESAAPGAWTVEVAARTPRGKVAASSTIQVVPGQDLAFSLVSADSAAARERTSFTRGESALVRLEGDAPVASASFVLVDPAGLGTGLRLDDAGNVTVPVPDDAALGMWEVRGVLAGENAVQRRAVGFEVYAPATFEVRTRGHAGDQAAVDVPALEGLVEPLRVRVANGAWLEQSKAIPILVDASSPEVSLLVEDARGRRALGTVHVEVVPDAPTADVPHATSGPTFGIVANVSQRTIFYPSFISLSQALRSGKLDPDWVVIEQGPLTATQLRDHVFERVPYDGPRASNPSSVYRSIRLWDRVSDPVKRSLAELGCKTGTIFDVTDTPSPSGEETLSAVVRRHVDEKGGWTYELERVSVHATGAAPDATPPAKPTDELRFDALASTIDAHAVGRVVAPGVLGDLTLRVCFPEKLVLGEPFSIAAATAAVTTALVPGRAYPGELEKLAARALLATYLEGSLEVDGKEQTLAVDPLASLDAKHPGRELVFSATPTGTDRDASATGHPRLAEHYRIQGLPLSKPKELDPPPAFTPIPPGTLENKPRRIRVHVKARLAIAVTPGDWPQGRPRPDPETVGGASFLVDPVDVPRTEIEVEASWVRVSPEGAPPRTPGPPAVGDVLVTTSDPAPLAPLDARGELDQASSALRSGRVDEAEAHARTAILADPANASAWTVLGEALLLEHRAEDALTPLRHASELAPDAGRPLVAIAEAQLELGRLKEARAAAKDAKAKKLTPDEGDRVARVLGD